MRFRKDSNMEQFQAKKEGDTLTIMLSGEIDHYSASAIKTNIDALIRSPQIMHMRLDFSGVSFMDSSGIGMIIGRYKTMKAKNGRVSATGLYPPVDRLFRIAGLHRIIAIDSAERREIDEE